MNQWTVEYYCSQCEEWLDCSREVYESDVDYTSAVYYCLDDAVKAMRSEVEDEPDSPHRIVRSVIHRSTVAMSVHGDELLIGDELFIGGK